MNRRQLAQWTLGACGALAAGLPARAQPRPMRLVVGFPAGGPADALTRMLGQALRAHTEGTPLVENRAGAGGRLAAEALRAADADGSVLLVSPSPVVTLYPHVYRRLAYDPVKDLLPVARLVTVPLVVAMGPMVPASVQTLAELVAWLKANPAKSSYGSAGAGTSFHFVGQMLGRATGIDLAHVAYRGEAPAVQDLMGGQIAVCIVTSASAIPQLPTGRLRVVATTAPQRIPLLPDVPTLLELGHPLQTADWFGAFLPGTATPATRQRAEDQLRAAVASAEFRDSLLKMNLQPGFLPGAELERAIREESAQWATVVRTTGFKPEE